jgi:hypothetical protein
MDMGTTAAFMKAAPVLLPRKESAFREGKMYKWGKAAFGRYFPWKMSRGLSGLP